MARKYSGPVYLEPIEHVYIHKVTGKRFNSVTKAISAIEPVFKAEEIAASIVMQSADKKNPEYLGMSQGDILDRWNKINEEANMYGSMVHQIVEDYLVANKWYNPKNEFEEAVVKAYDELNIDEGIEIYPERIMFSEEFELAGMTDLLVDIDDIYFDIGDWKTNKEFRFFSPYKTLLLPPFDYLQDCQYSVYTLQLSMYALMYEMETGKKCRQLWAAHFNKETLKFTKVPIMYLKHEAKKLMNLHKYKVALENCETKEKFEI